MDAKLPEPDILEKDGGFMVVLHKANVEDSVKGSQIGAQIGGAIEQFIIDFGTLASRKMLDSEMNKEILPNNFGLFSE